MVYATACVYRELYGKITDRVLPARGQIQMDQSELRVKLPGHKPLRKAEEVNFKAKFSFVTSLSAAETHVFGVEFIGLYGTVVFIAIRDFSC